MTDQTQERGVREKEMLSRSHQMNLWNVSENTALLRDIRIGESLTAKRRTAAWP